MMLATRIAQEFNNVRDHLSLPAAYHLLGGNLSVDATVLTTGFGLYLYTGNGGTQSINLGMDLTTHWGDSPNETYGYLIKIKSRNAVGNWTWVDSVRGITKYISSNTTAVEGTDANMFTLSTVAGVTTLNIGTSTRTNTNGVTYVVEVYQTTHKKTGVTNQGKSYTEHYNPKTGFTIEGFEGSGLAGHEIPHSLGRKLGIYHIKNTSTTATDWFCQYQANETVFLKSNLTDAVVSGAISTFNTNSIVLNAITPPINQASQNYLVIGWANSYLDESDKLIGNFEIGVYQGTGVSGNKVTTKGKPAWIMIKRLDSTGDWPIFDNQRDDIVSSTNDGVLWANTSGAEATTTNFISLATNDGFTINDITTNTNASGGQYMYIIVHDNDSGSGKSKYPKATDTVNVQINNGIIPLAHGIDSNGSKNSIVVKNETIAGVTYAEGANYLYRIDTSYGVKSHRPRYLKSDLVRTYPTEQPDYFDITKNKWYNTLAVSELVTNGTFDTNTTGWTPLTSTLTVVNGILVITNVGTNYGSASQTINTTIGKKYTLKVSVDSGTSTASFDFTNGATSRLYSVVSGHYETTIDFIAQAVTVTLRFVNASNVAGHISYAQNISIFETNIMIGSEITESRNYMNHVVHADASGNVLYVEELPKIEYKNIIKAEKYLGSNAIALSVAFDLTTTPITIKGKMIGAKAVIRTGTGIADIYLKDDLKGTELKLEGISNGNQVRVLAIADNKITIETSNSSGTATNYTYTSINGVGE